MLSNSKRFSGKRGCKMQLDERRLGAVLPGRAKMSFRAPSMSTVAKVVGRLKGKNVTEITIMTTNKNGNKLSRMYWLTCVS